MKIKIDTVENYQEKDVNKQYFIEIPGVNGWNYRIETSGSALKNIRDRIDDIFAIQEVSSLYGICEKDGAKIVKNYHLNEKMCSKCEFRGLECDKCVLVCSTSSEVRLFLEMRKHNLNPDLQKRIYKDGTVYDYFQEIDESKILTIPSFYFDTGDKKLCIYIDNHVYYGGTMQDKVHDKYVDRELELMGCKVMRFGRQTIARKMDFSIGMIQKALGIELEDPMRKIRNKIFSFSNGKLINLLQKYPEDMPVVASAYGAGYDNLYSLFVKKVSHHPDNPYYQGLFQEDDDAENTFEAIILERDGR
jgi:hypothetical protein